MDLTARIISFMGGPHWIGIVDMIALACTLHSDIEQLTKHFYAQTTSLEGNGVIDLNY